jgi:UDP-hydrolysing UDP-N-acetyl-D-glucosamine 2-epimerase
VRSPSARRASTTSIAPSSCRAPSSNAALDLTLDRPTALVTFHPVTTEPGEGLAQVEALLAALLAEAPLQAVFTQPNADAEGRAIHARVVAFCRSHPERFRLVPNLGTQRYLSCLQHLDLLVGNSSSGLIEAPSFALPVVNVGTRQRGRLRAANVIDVDPYEAAIRGGLRHAASKEFRDSLCDMTNPYDPNGDGRVSERIVSALKTYARDPGSRRKAFVDLEIGA